jgi:hypothetical protein
VQGHIWHAGFVNGSIKAELFRDVPDALVQWRSAGLKTYIYSSGSREAQRDLFGHTTAGDLRPYLSGFFDTRVGAKVCADTSTLKPSWLWLHSALPSSTSVSYKISLKSQTFPCVFAGGSAELQGDCTVAGCG